MIASAPADSNQLLCPIPAIGDDIEFARTRKLKISDHLLGHGNFGMEPAASLDTLSMIEPGPKGQEIVSVKQGRKDPLVAKDIGHIFRMIFVPGATGDLFSTLLSDRIVDNEKDHTTGFDSEGLEEPAQGDLHQPVLSPRVLAEESGEA